MWGERGGGELWALDANGHQQRWILMYWKHDAGNEMWPITILFRIEWKNGFAFSLALRREHVIWHYNDSCTIYDSTVDLNYIIDVNDVNRRSIWMRCRRFGRKKCESERFLQASKLVSLLDLFFEGFTSYFVPTFSMNELLLIKSKMDSHITILNGDFLGIVLSYYDPPRTNMILEY